MYCIKSIYYLIVLCKSANTFPTRSSNCHTLAGFKQIVVNNCSMDLVLEDDIETLPAYLQSKCQILLDRYQMIKTKNLSTKNKKVIQCIRIYRNRTDFGETSQFTASNNFAKAS
jgi:hypothetical protein